MSGCNVEQSDMGALLRSEGQWESFESGKDRIPFKLFQELVVHLTDDADQNESELQAFSVLDKKNTGHIDKYDLERVLEGLSAPWAFGCLLSFM